MSDARRLTDADKVEALKAQLAERDKLLDVEHAKGFREGYLLATKQLRSDLGEANELLERFQDKYVSASAKIVEQELKLDEAVKALHDCRAASKVDEPMIDKMVIRNITGVALAKLKAGE